MRLYNFSALVGNKVSISLLQRSLMNGSIKNFVIMAGIMGTGKSTCAEITGLYLTCERPVNGEPCLSCDSCKTNIKALQTTGTSLNLVKKNLGLISNKKDINELIKEVFILQGSIGNNVYILEEAHVLSPNDQTALLEEIDRLGDRTFVILCTTRPQKLLPELVSRATPVHKFVRLTRTESKMLFDRTVKKMEITKIGKEVESMITRFAAGVPRDMVRLIEFVRDNKPTENEVRDFLGMISNEAFLSLFSSMQASMHETALVTDDLLNRNSLDTVISEFKKFMVNCIFLVEGVTSDEFTKEEVGQVRAIFTDDVCYKAANVVEKLDPYRFTEADFKLAIVRIRQIVNGKGMGTIFSESKGQASAQNISARTSFNEDQRVRDDSQEGKVATITPEFMKSFNKEN